MDVLPFKRKGSDSMAGTNFVPAQSPLQQPSAKRVAGQWTHVPPGAQCAAGGIRARIGNVRLTLCDAAASRSSGDSSHRAGQVTMPTVGPPITPITPLPPLAAGQVVTNVGVELGQEVLGPTLTVGRPLLPGQWLQAGSFQFGFQYGPFTNGTVASGSPVLRFRLPSGQPVNLKVLPCKTGCSPGYYFLALTPMASLSSSTAVRPARTSRCCRSPAGAHPFGGAVPDPCR